MLAELADRANPVGDDVVASGYQHPHLPHHRFVGLQVGEVASHAGLVGYHPRVLGVRLSFAAVASGGAVDGATGQVLHSLVMVEEYRQQQRRFDGDQIDRPRHVGSLERPDFGQQ